MKRLAEVTVKRDLAWDWAILTIHAPASSRGGKWCLTLLEIVQF
jgi:hypothetical protein